MFRLWLIQLFWFALALPGYAVLRRWDRESLRRGFLYGLARCYLASFTLLTPLSVLGYWRNWPLWTFSATCALTITVGAIALARDHNALWAGLRKPSLLAAVSCALIGVDLWLGVRAGAHTQGDAGYHVARVRMLIVDGLSNWDPIVAQPRLDVIYHTNLYHALIAASAQLTGSDAVVAWLATWPFAKLLVAAGVGQLACCVFGAPAAAWLASLAVLVSQSAYSALPFPNTLAPLALLPMGLCAATELWSERAPLAAAWLAASAIALAQMHALNAVFLALIVGPVLVVVLLLRGALALLRVKRRAGPRAGVLVLGLLACGASLPWLVVAGAPRMQQLVQLALPALKAAAPLPQPKDRAETKQQEEPESESEPSAETNTHQSNKSKPVYKAERFRKLDNGRSVYEPGNLRGPYNTHGIMAAVVLSMLALRPRRELGALALFLTMTCAWLLVPTLCSALLFLTGAPWAALRITQVLPVASYALVPAAPLFWLARVPSTLGWRRWAELPLLAAALGFGSLQISHGEPWTPERLWQRALDYEARTQWERLSTRQALLCGPIPKGEVVMAHPRWDYGLPMLCRNSVIALGPGRGWHGLPYMHKRRAHVDEFFHENTSGPRRIELMRKYQTRYVYTSRRIARRIVRSLPDASRIVSDSRQGAVLEIDTAHRPDTQEAGD